MHIRLLAPDVAMMYLEFHIYGDSDAPTRTGIGTRVVRKINGRWRLLCKILTCALDDDTKQSALQSNVAYWPIATFRGVGPI